MSSVKSLGVASVGVGAMCCLFSTAHGGHDLSGLAAVGVVFVILGVGLFLRLKWAAVIAVFLSVACGMCFVVGSVIYVPLPWALVNILMGVCFFLPGILVVRDWASLR